MLIMANKLIWLVFTLFFVETGFACTCVFKDNKLPQACDMEYLALVNVTGMELNETSRTFNVTIESDLTRSSTSILQVNQSTKITTPSWSGLCGIDHLETGKEYLLGGTIIPETKELYLHTCQSFVVTWEPSWNQTTRDEKLKYYRELCQNQPQKPNKEPK